MYSCNCCFCDCCSRCRRRWRTGRRHQLGCRSCRSDASRALGLLYHTAMHKPARGGAQAGQHKGCDCGWPSARPAVAPIANWRGSDSHTRAAAAPGGQPCSDSRSPAHAAHASSAHFTSSIGIAHRTLFPSPAAAHILTRSLKPRMPQLAICQSKLSITNLYRGRPSHLSVRSMQGRRS